MKSTPAQYGSTAVALHWVSALLVLVLIVTGFRSGFAEDAATKAAALRIHVPVAMAALLLTALRLLRWWRFDQKPSPEPGTPAWQDAVARWTHRALYLALILLLASGIAMSVMSGLPSALFGTADLPDFASLPPAPGTALGPA